MAATAAQSRILANPAPGRRCDHFFFSAMSILILVVVFVGFAPTYYFAGVFRAHLPAPIIHIHGAVFSCWVLLLVVQTSLVSARRVDMHRRLGIFGFCLAALMVVLGVLAATNALARGSAPPGLDPKFFYVIPIGDMFSFAVLIFFAFHFRSNSSAHKRLVLIATVALLTAAFARWPVAFLLRKPSPAMLVAYGFLRLLALYDLWSTHKIQRVTLCGSAFLMFVQFARIPLGQTAIWRDFAGWAQALAR